MNIPNTLTAFRLVMIPFFCVFFVMGPQYYPYAGIVLVLSGLSDMFDGFLARKLNQETELGKILDPVADKLTLGAVVISMWFVYRRSYPWITLALGIMFVKELLMAIGGLVIYARSMTVKSRSVFYSMAACSASGLLVFQAALHIFGGLGMIPMTGLTLPFLSYGGTSMMACWGLLAFIKSADERTFYRMKPKAKRGEVLI